MLDYSDATFRAILEGVSRRTLEDGVRYVVHTMDADDLLRVIHEYDPAYYDYLAKHWATKIEVTGIPNLGA